MGGRAAGEVDLALEEHRVGLTGFCYRMLGSPFEAEDAVQEALLRAWRSRERFDEQQGPLRPWLYRIATNVCLDMLRSPQRRARAMDLAPPARPGPDIGVPLPESAWVLPIPEHRAVPTGGDPAEAAVLRESIRLAFVAALQRLPPRQRAVLVLRDVLCWRADEVARLLDTTVGSVTSALQRARVTLREPSMVPAGAMDEGQQRLLARYCDAFERYDVEAMVALLHEDVTTSMPPFPWWLRGRDAVRATLLAAGRPCDGARLVPAAPCGSPAFGQYLPAGPGGGHRAFALLVVTVAGGRITDLTTHLAAERLFPLFGLPEHLGSRAPMGPGTDESGAAAP